MFAAILLLIIAIGLFATSVFFFINPQKKERLNPNWDNTTLPWRNTEPRFICKNDYTNAGLAAIGGVLFAVGSGCLFSISKKL